MKNLIIIFGVTLTLLAACGGGSSSSSGGGSSSSSGGGSSSSSGGGSSSGSGGGASAPLPSQALLASASKLNLKAMVQAADIYFAAGDYVNANKWYSWSSDPGLGKPGRPLSPKAQNRRGRMNELPGILSTFGNEAFALKWYKFAAAQGHTEGQYNAARLHMAKLSESEPSEALRLYKLVANNNRHAGAQFRLGEMYENGEGVAENKSEAIKWYELAAAQTSTRKPEWYEFASVQEDANKAKTNLGLLYANGFIGATGGTPNYQKAKSLLLTGANNGNSDAQTKLGEMYENGKGVAENKSEAIKWYKKAARTELGHAVAMYNLSVMYEKGQGTQKNLTTAYMWILAAETGKYGSRDTTKIYANKQHLTSLMQSIQITTAYALAEACKNKKYKGC